MTIVDELVLVSIIIIVTWLFIPVPKLRCYFQVSHQGNHIPGGFSSGTPMDCPSAFMHQYQKPGVYYYIRWVQWMNGLFIFVERDDAFFFILHLSLAIAQIYSTFFCKLSNESIVIADNIVMVMTCSISVIPCPSYLVLLWSPHSLQWVEHYL